MKENKEVWGKFTFEETIYSDEVEADITNTEPVTKNEFYKALTDLSEKYSDGTYCDGYGYITFNDKEIGDVFCDDFSDDDDVKVECDGEEISIIGDIESVQSILNSLDEDTKFDHAEFNIRSLDEVDDIDYDDNIDDINL